MKTFPFSTFYVIKRKKRIWNYHFLWDPTNNCISKEVLKYIHIFSNMSPHCNVDKLFCLKMTWSPRLRVCFRGETSYLAHIKKKSQIFASFVLINNKAHLALLSPPLISSNLNNISELRGYYGTTWTAIPEPSSYGKSQYCAFKTPRNCFRKKIWTFFLWTTTIYRHDANLCLTRLYRCILLQAGWSNHQTSHNGLEEERFRDRIYCITAFFISMRAMICVSRISLSRT